MKEGWKEGRKDKIDDDFMEEEEEEMSVKRLDGNDSKYYYCDAFDVSIGGGGEKILTIFTALETTISKWIGDIKKIHHRNKKKKKKKNHPPLIIGFCAEREVRHKKGGLEDNPIDILTLYYGGHCLIVDISRVVGSYIYDSYKEYRSFYGFSKSLKDFLTDSNNTVLVGLDMEKVSIKFEKDFGFKLGRTVDLQSLAEKVGQPFLIQQVQGGGGGGQKMMREKEEERRKVVVGKCCKLDDLLNRVMEPEEELKIRRPTKKIEIYGGDIFGGDGINEEKVLYTTLDGFVAWKIGTKYVDLIKNN